MSLHSITDTMIKTAEINAETIAAQDRTIHNLTFQLGEARRTIDELRTELAAANAQIVELLEAIDIMAEKLTQEPQ